MKPRFNLNHRPRLGALALAFLLPGSLFSTTVSASGTSASQPVSVYQHVNFSGNSQGFDDGDSAGNLIYHSIGDDTISSIRVQPGFEVTVCRHRRLNGRCETFTDDISDLRRIGFNDLISSLIVRQISVENSPPVIAAEFTETTDADSILNFSVLSVVSDADSSQLTFTSLRDSSLPGVLTDDGAGNFTFDPQGAFGNLLIGETTTQSFDYEVSDGLASTTGTITITIEGTTAPINNTPPIASDLQISTATDSTLDIELLGSAADADGNVLMIANVSDLTPNIGVLTDIGNGIYRFDPSGMFTGTQVVSFTYTVSDGYASDTGEVEVTVTECPIIPRLITISEISLLQNDAFAPLARDEPQFCFLITPALIHQAELTGPLQNDLGVNRYGIGHSLRGSQIAEAGTTLSDSEASACAVAFGCENYDNPL